MATSSATLTSRRSSPASNPSTARRPARPSVRLGVANHRFLSTTKYGRIAIVSPRADVQRDLGAVEVLDGDNRFVAVLAEDAAVVDVDAVDDVVHNLNDSDLRDVASLLPANPLLPEGVRDVLGGEVPADDAGEDGPDDFGLDLIHHELPVDQIVPEWRAGEPSPDV